MELVPADRIEATGVDGRVETADPAFGAITCGGEAAGNLITGAGDGE